MPSVFSVDKKGLAGKVAKTMNGERRTKAKNENEERKRRTKTTVLLDPGTLGPKKLIPNP